MQKMHICHICGEEMYPVLETKEYRLNNIPVTVYDIRVFRCVNCGEGILESEEVERIEKIVFSKFNKKD
jgi:YgiT-type zinc finger domain-containing protein